MFLFFELMSVALVNINNNRITFFMFYSYINFVTFIDGKQATTYCL